LEGKMKKTEHPLPTFGACLAADDVARHLSGWLLDSEYRNLSARTVDSRRMVADKLLWYLRRHGLATCGPAEIRAFLTYVAKGGSGAEGRWGTGRPARPIKSSTPTTYFARLRSFFNFLLDEGAIEASPMATLKPPVSRSDQIQPFTEEQIADLQRAARASEHPRRDVAILLLLLDTGMRASELCALLIGDLDLQEHRCTVHGKGNKARTVFYSRDTARALYSLLRDRPGDPNAAVFVADRGLRAGEALTRGGLLQLFHRLGAAACIRSTRCSPHTLRHTAAVWFLKEGGHVFALKEMLGHTDLKCTSRYVALAQADVQAQHARFSPVARLRRTQR
jgi:site-specific recombinase XerD